MIAALFLVLTALGCQAPPPGGGASASASAPAPALESGVAESGTVLAVPEDSDSAVSADSDFGEVPDVEDPFGLLAPAFSGIGFQSHTSNCDPFDDAYGTCL